VDLVGAEQLEAGHLDTEAEPQQTHRVGVMVDRAAATARLTDNANLSVDIILSW